MLNVLKTANCTVDTFGGLCTQTGPTSTPKGLATDCQDVVFFPGQIQSRPCLDSLLTSAIGTTDITYLKTYVQPNEVALNLILSSDGNLWREDVDVSPGAKTLIQQLVAGSYANSVSAFGREYIALNDGLHGTDVPLQYDGTNLDRVSQDGPGSPAVSTETDNTGIAISSIAPLSAIAATALVANSGPGDNIYRTTAPGADAPFLQIGDNLLFSGSTNPAFDGTKAIVNRLPSPSQEMMVDYGSYIVLFSATNIQTGLYIVTTATAYAGITTQATIAGAANPLFDGTWPVRNLIDSTHLLIAVTTPGLAAVGAAGTLAVPGQISAGVHKCVVMFLTRQGYITKPSPVATWLASGSQAVTVSGIPIGPANVIARIVAFTGAGGDNFFYIPATITIPDPSGGPATVVNSTIIPDNTSSSATFNFDDNSLFSATAIDIPGNNLFALVVLGPCLGMAQFAARLLAWGERNKIQNFLNMGFDGGYISSNPTVPTGWFNSTTDGGGLFNGGAWASGQAWLITGNGTAAQRGLLTQSAYQDEDGQAIILPSTNYTARAWLRRTGGTGGFVAFLLNSASLGVISQGSISISDVSTVGEFHEVDLSGVTPATIPSDIQLQIYAQNQDNLATVTMDEAELIYTDNPFTDTIFRGSYVLNPESFDGVTGTIGALGDPSPIRAPFLLRNTFYFNTALRLQATADNSTGEPSTWNVAEVDKVGALSSRATASGGEGEDWQFFASRAGVYVFSGSTPMKLMQEMQSSPDGTVFPTWEDINWGAQSAIWMTNDPVNRRLYVAVPTSNIEAAPWTAPSIIFVMDYKNLESAEAIASRGALFPMGNGLGTGDLARKWTRWNCFLDCGAIINRTGNITTFAVGAGNGVPPGDSASFGQIYQFSEDKLTDDDYGQISPFYQTSFLVPDDEAQGIGVSTHRKQAAYLTAFLQGQGNMVITPYVDTAQNAWPSTPNLPMTLTRNFDTEIGMNVLGERIAFRFTPQPLTGETDVFFSLGTMSVAFRPDPWSPIRGAF